MLTFSRSKYSVKLDAIIFPSFFFGLSLFFALSSWYGWRSSEVELSIVSLIGCFVLLGVSIWVISQRTVLSLTINEREIVFKFSRGSELKIVRQNVVGVFMNPALSRGIGSHLVFRYRSNGKDCDQYFGNTMYCEGKKISQKDLVDALNKSLGT